MVKNLIKHGNSYALVIDKPIMELLHIQPETELELSTDGKSLMVRPVDIARQEKFQKVMDETFEQYHEAFKKLAE
ncbi:MAG: AbrB/MazE/SpoVT family DNA-binding domain-containing protein [Planctomycetota bacterium]|jgi:antitoxin component of MazEF toxin-antitoxin module